MQKKHASDVLIKKVLGSHKTVLPSYLAIPLTDKLTYSCLHYSERLDLTAPLKDYQYNTYFDCFLGVYFNWQL